MVNSQRMVMKYKGLLAIGAVLIVFLLFILLKGPQKDSALTPQPKTTEAVHKESYDLGYANGYNAAKEENEAAYQQGYEIARKEIGSGAFTRFGILGFITGLLIGIGSVVITPNQIAIILTALIVMGLLYLLLKKTKIGKAMRASSDNLDLADVSGIDIDRVISMVWVIGSILAGIGGILLALDTNLHPEMGAINLIKGFAAAILGGVGNIPGAIVGGFFIGFAENLGIWFINPGYKDAIAFGIIIIVLLTRASRQYLLRET